MGRPQNIDRNLVLDAAEAIVLERGAAELTIDAVAQSVGITKGGVQYCFGTKAGLIDAMVDRWCREFQAEIDELTAPTNDPIAAIGGYVEATAKINKLTHARAAGMMAVLLQSPEHMEAVRRWYREHLQPLDLSTAEGKKARIAFMAMEGAFLLRSFGFMQMSDTEWGELFGEIKATLPVPLPSTAPELPAAQQTGKRSHAAQKSAKQSRTPQQQPDGDATESPTITGSTSPKAGGSSAKAGSGRANSGPVKAAPSAKKAASSARKITRRVKEPEADLPNADDNLPFFLF